jgi:hypothetical protein
MSGNKQDVEELMQDLRGQIAAEGHTEKELEEARKLAYLDGSDKGPEFFYPELAAKARYLDTHYENPILFAPEGNPVKVALQKLILKTVGFTYFRAFRHQNAFNKEVAGTVEELTAFIRMQEKENAALREQVERLEAQLKGKAE